MPNNGKLTLADVKAALSRHLILWLMSADSEVGELRTGEPAWIPAICQDKGLVMPGNQPGVWKLSPLGWDVWRLLRPGHPRSPQGAVLRRQTRQRADPSVDVGIASMRETSMIDKPSEDQPAQGEANKQAPD